MRGELALVNARNAPSGINRALGMAQRVSANVGGQNLDVPRVGERQSIGDGNGDGIRLLAGGTAGAPDSQSARILPEFLGVQFRKNAFLESVIDRGIPEEGSLLRE